MQLCHHVTPLNCNLTSHCHLLTSPRQSLLALFRHLAYSHNQLPASRHLSKLSCHPLLFLHRHLSVNASPSSYDAFYLSINASTSPFFAALSSCNTFKLSFNTFMSPLNAYQSLFTACLSPFNASPSTFSSFNISSSPFTVYACLPFALQLLSVPVYCLPIDI